MIMIAKALDLSVVAGDVERREELDLLLAPKCVAVRRECPGLQLQIGRGAYVGANTALAALPLSGAELLDELRHLAGAGAEKPRRCKCGDQVGDDEDDMLRERNEEQVEEALMAPDASASGSNGLIDRDLALLRF